MQPNPKGGRLEWEQSLGRRFVAPACGQVGPTRLPLVFLTGGHCGDQRSCKMKVHSDLIKTADDPQLFTVKSFYIGCLISQQAYYISIIMSLTYEVRKLRLREEKLINIPMIPGVESSRAGTLLGLDRH